MAFPLPQARCWDHCSPAVAESLAAEISALLNPRHGAADRRPPAWLSRVTELVRARYRESLPLAVLAAEAGVHPAYLSGVFRRFTGVSPGEMTRELRVRRVCEALADKDRPLAELALEAGFADQAHMTRIFTRYTGTPPGALRESLKAR